MATREQTESDLSALIGDKYEILRWIGGGGMAEVYLARHRMHGGLFAVKVLNESLAKDPKIVARFLQEARTAATLSGHPNIVPIFDVDEGRGLHYIVMQYVAGEDLGRYLEREGPLAPRDALNIVSQVADALVSAASNGIVHRDLKSSNIRLDRYGRAVVLDFGISKASDEPSALTAAGETLGTPHYMSPEQIRGERCDQRSDLYSLGVIFFELLTKRRPFEAGTYHAVFHGHLNVPAPSPCDLIPAIDPKCCAIVLKLLEKDPARRFQSAAELREALQFAGCAGGASLLHPIMDGPADHDEGKHSGKPPSQPPHHRKRWPVVAGIAASALAIGALMYFAASNRHESARLPPDTRAVKPAAALPAETADENGVMLLVAAGQFIFGDDSPESPNPRQTVSLPAFYIDKTEVSNARYLKFCEATGRARPPGSVKRPQYPVTAVNFDDASAFAKWAEKRLPTEREWEKAARGADGRIFPWGDETRRLPASLQPVGSVPAGVSPSGALDMVGNVYEWTTTPFPVIERELADMRSVLGTGSVSRNWYSIKGGSFAPGQEIFLRTYMRRGWPAEKTSPLLGFRCVKDALPRVSTVP